MVGAQTEIESSSLDRCDAAYQNGANIPDNHADYSVFLYARWVSMGGRIKAINYLDQLIQALPKSKPQQEQQQMHLKLCKNDIKTI